jgi:hypothetical protein
MSPGTCFSDGAAASGISTYATPGTRRFTASAVSGGFRGQTAAGFDRSAGFPSSTTATAFVALGAPLASR